MRKPRIGHLALTFAAALSLYGCHGNRPAPYPNWAPPSVPYSPSGSSSNAFDAYALAALDVQAKAGPHLTRVSFYPGQKRAAMQVCAPAVSQVIAASRQPCNFKFVPRPPFTPAPYHAGWRLIGRCLRWRIEDQVASGDYDGAIATALASTRFGFALTGGGATDAALGFVIADDARRALTPGLNKMGAAQLQHLADGVEEALVKKPPLATAFANESLNMRLAVQTLQDALQKDDFSALAQNLGPDSREAIAYLRDLKEKESEREVYFQKFVAEGDAEFRYLADNGDKPVAKRQKEPSFPGNVERPWKRFAHHFFMTGRPIVEMNDRTLTRSRLLVLNARILAVYKSAGAYPGTLANLPSEVKLDPYTGESFLYRQDGAQFAVYSVGENLRDDGGDTDESYTTPDLTLEWDR